MKAVVFDFDNTITITDTTKLLALAFCIGRPLLFRKTMKWVVSEKNNDAEKRQEEKCDLIGSYIKNYPEKVVASWVKLYRYFVNRFINFDVKNTMSRYRNSGYKIIIATASPSFAVKTMFPGDVAVIGTDFLLEGSKYSGRYHTPCFGREKKERVVHLIKHTGIMSIEAAYSDDESDLPTLELAEKKFWVKHGKIVQF